LLGDVRSRSPVRANQPAGCAMALLRGLEMIRPAPAWVDFGRRVAASADNNETSCPYLRDSSSQRADGHLTADLSTG